MKKIALFVSTFIILVACNNNSENVKQAATAESTEQQITQIELIEFDTKAGDFVDQVVLVTGIVDHVCKHGGKKLFLVNDDGEVHVESDDRFDDELIGSSVVVNGIVREFRVDEGYCLKMEEDNIQNHKEGVNSKEEFEEKMAHIQEYRDEMAENGVDHLSYYSLEFVSLEEIPETSEI